MLLHFTSDLTGNRDPKVTPWTVLLYRPWTRLAGMRHFMCKNRTALATVYRNTFGMWAGGAWQNVIFVVKYSLIKVVLRRHVLLHHYKAYSCSLCSTSCAKPLFVKHMATHPAKWNSPMPKSSSRKKQAKCDKPHKTHYTQDGPRANKNKPWCGICKRSFCDMRSLKRHNQARHMELL